MTARHNYAIVVCMTPAIVLAGCSATHFEMQHTGMRPYIRYRDIVEVDSGAYERGSPSRWDVVMIHRPNDTQHQRILRVVGLPGETLSLADGDLVVDGEPVSAPSPLAGIRYSSLEAQPLSVRSDSGLVVPSNHYYLVGDASNAYDSRFFGAVHRNHICGRIQGVVSRWEDRKEQAEQTRRFLEPILNVMFGWLQFVRPPTG